MINMIRRLIVGYAVVSTFCVTEIATDIDIGNPSGDCME